MIGRAMAVAARMAARRVAAVIEGLLEDIDRPHPNPSPEGEGLMVERLPDGIALRGRDLLRRWVFGGWR